VIEIVLKLYSSTRAQKFFKQADEREKLYQNKTE